MVRDEPESTSPAPGAARPAAAPYIRDAWYVVHESAAVRRRPVSVTRFGRRLVLWRDAAGTIVIQEARCPHRGADLGLGRVVEGALECPYHGFRFNPAGACTLVPCQGKDWRAPASMKVPTYTVREEHGLIWLWWGDAREDYPPLPWLPRFPDEPARTSSGTLEWDIPLPLVLESAIDFHHVAFAHRRVMPGVGTLVDPFEVEREGDVIRSRGVIRKDDGQPYDGASGFPLELDVHFPGVIAGRFSPRITLFAAICPIDHDNTWMVFRYHMRLPVLAKLAAWLMVWAELKLVQPDDMRMGRSALACGRSPDPALSGCRAVPADANILQWYKLYRRRLAAQRGRDDEAPPAKRLPIAVGE